MTARALRLLVLVAVLCSPALAQVTRPGGGVVPPTKLGGGGGSGGSGTVTSIVAGAGLSGGTITVSGTIALNMTTTTCSTGQVVTAISSVGVGTCATFFKTAGTGLSAFGSTVNVNLTTTTCSSGSAETSTAADGTSTCTAVVVSAAAASGGGLAVSTSSGAVTAGLITSCGANQVLAFVSSAWTCSTPTTGTVTSIVAGTGLSGGTITGSGTIAVNLTTTSCSAGQFVSAISAVGVGTCTTAITTAGTGLSATGSTLSVNLTTTSCSSGSAETATAANGTSTCSAVVDTMAATASGGLACSTSSGAASCGLITSCSANQVLKFVSSVWTCAADANSGGTVTSIVAGTGLSGGTITGTGTIAVNLTTTSCSSGQAVTAISATGTGTCSTMVNSVAASSTGGLVVSTSSGVATVGLIQTCSTGDVIQWEGAGSGGWICSANPLPAVPGTVTSIVAGTGLSGGTITTTGTIGLNLTTTSCSAGTAVTAISSVGVGTCSFVLTSIGSTTGGGLAFSTSSGVGSGGLITSCSSNQYLAWSGTAWACTSPATGAVPIYGTGADGACHYTTNTNLTRAAYCTTVVVDTGVTLQPCGFGVFATTSITLTGTGRIAADGGGGGNASGGSLGGSGGAQTTCGSWGYLPQGAVGGNGATGTGNGGGGNPSAAAPISSSATGGGGGSAQATGLGGAAGALTADRTDLENFFGALTGGAYFTVAPSFGASGITAGTGGGAGGADAGAGGGGGAGGSTVLVASPSILGTGTISAVGGNGGNGAVSTTGGGAGGGGGGGIAIVFTPAANATPYTVTVAGGATGTPGTGGHTGASGSAGVKYTWDPSLFGLGGGGGGGGSGTITNVIAGTSLTGGGTSGAVTLNVALPGGTCTNGQVIGTLGADGTATCVDPHVNDYGSKHLEWIEEFMGPNFTVTTTGTQLGGPWSVNLSGGNASIFGTTAARPGLEAFATGTTTTGRIGLVTNTQAVEFGAGSWDMATTLGWGTLATGTDTFATLIGFADTVTAIDQVDGCYFLYDHGNVATSGTNSGNADKLSCWCASNSVRTTYLMDGSTTSDESFVTVNAPVAALTLPSTNIYSLDVKMTLSTRAEFYVNGVKSCDINTNVPTGTNRVTGGMVSIVKSAGTTSRALIIDRIKLAVDMTSARSP